MIMIWRLLLLAAFLVVVGPRAVPGQPGELADPGRRLYVKYCAACHGSEGMGDGVVSGFMRPKPTDLTQMAKREGGRFPFLEMMRVIDGRTAIRAHGDPDMPVWGEVLRPDITSTLAQSAELRGRMMLITEYIASIQVK